MHSNPGRARTGSVRHSTVNSSMSERAEEDELMDSFGKQYGYPGQIDEIRKQEFKRLEGINISCRPRSNATINLVALERSIT